MEYTLEDAFKTLEIAQTKREQEIGDLRKEISNKKSAALDKSSDPVEVRKKQHKFCESLLQQVVKEEPKDYPIPNTSDLHHQTLKELEDEVRKAQQLLAQMNWQLANVNKDLIYLECKRDSLEKMEEASSGAAQLTANTTYNRELIVTKHLYHSVKRDLSIVVDKLFPGNRGFQLFLAALAAAYTKGGDNLYVNVSPEDMVYVNFLMEADITTYHRNDKNKVRLTDML